MPEGSLYVKLSSLRTAVEGKDLSHTKLRESTWQDQILTTWECHERVGGRDEPFIYSFYSFYSNNTFGCSNMNLCVEISVNLFTGFAEVTKSLDLTSTCEPQNDSVAPCKSQIQRT